MPTAVTERPIPTGEGLTFEKVWAIFQETGRKIQEVSELQKETAQQMKETDRIVKENARQMGDLHNRFGELAEHLVAPGILEKFNELGYEFTRCSQNVKIREPGSRSIIAQLDILLENGDTAIAVEVKAKPRISDIKDFMEKMEKLRSHADRVHDKRKYNGTIAAAILGDDVRREILRNGIFVTEQTGDTMKITIPNGFIPREW